MVSIGLTGGYASGKTTVARILEELGAVVVDADRLAHEVIRRGEPGWRETVAAFGRGVLGAEGEIDRAALGRLVFAAPDLRARLEGIIHPRVIAAIRKARQEAQADGVRVFVAEVPLLFEVGLAGEFDRVWVVTSDPRRQRELAKGRDRLSDVEIEARLAAQLPLAEKERRADLVLRNDGDLDALRAQVEQAWADLTPDPFPEGSR